MRVAFRDSCGIPAIGALRHVDYWMGNAYSSPKTIATVWTAISAGQQVWRHPRVPEAMLNIADAVGLKNRTLQKKHLKQLISQFPGTDAADKAKATRHSQVIS